MPGFYGGIIPVVVAAAEPEINNDKYTQISLYIRFKSMISPFIFRCLIEDEWRMNLNGELMQKLCTYNGLIDISLALKRRPANQNRSSH